MVHSVHTVHMWYTCGTHVVHSVHTVYKVHTVDTVHMVHVVYSVHMLQVVHILHMIHMIHMVHSYQAPTKTAPRPLFKFKRITDEHRPLRVNFRYSRMGFKMVLRRVTCPNFESLHRFTVDNKGSCFPAKESSSRTNVGRRIFRVFCRVISAVKVKLSHQCTRTDTSSVLKS